MSLSDVRVWAGSAFDEYADESPVYAPPQAHEVEWCEDEPVGLLLGPDGAPLSVVMPEREPFGFQPRGLR